MIKFNSYVCSYVQKCALVTFHFMSLITIKFCVGYIKDNFQKNIVLYFLNHRNYQLKFIL